MAPDFVKDLKSKIPADCYRLLDLDDESRELAEAYIEEKILGKASLDDACHIAIATVNRLDVLVSWNFKHIVNYDKHPCAAILSVESLQQNGENVCPME